MPKTRPPYDAAFRKAIVALARRGREPSDLADEFEPTETTIRNWIEKADAQNNYSEGRKTEQEEPCGLRGELTRVKAERDALARVVAFFARKTADADPS